MSPDRQQDGATSDIRPLVAGRGKSRLPWFFAAGLGLCAVLLFQTLEARRAALREPSVLAPRDDRIEAGRAAPDLFIPPEVIANARGPFPLEDAGPRRLQPLPAPVAQVDRPTQQGRGIGPPPFPERPWSTQAAPALSASLPGPMPAPSASPGPAASTDKDSRTVARWFDHPGTTVPRGTVMQAVLESALDSTRGGFARAIVTRDIYGFDGSRVLVQRGSRILGQYKSDVASGQNRILIQWQRLTRPDGVIIDLDSPSADPLGRAGVKGKVNTHFFERFGGAILQSTLDVGVQLAARSASRGTVVVALPGSVQQATQIVPQQQIQPTIKVKQGTSVSVFVAQDLDFTDVEE
jgi:type IV secretion system protein VirB10